MMQRLKLTQLINIPVRHPNGQALGAVGEIDIDPVRGAVERVTLRLDADPRLSVIVPWSQLRYSNSDHCLELSIGRKTLETVASRRGR